MYCISGYFLENGILRHSHSFGNAYRDTYRNTTAKMSANATSCNKWAGQSEAAGRDKTRQGNGCVFWVDEISGLVNSQ